MDVLASSLRTEDARLRDSIAEIKRREEDLSAELTDLETAVQVLESECCGSAPEAVADIPDDAPAWLAALAGGSGAGVLAGLGGGWLASRLRPRPKPPAPGRRTGSNSSDIDDEGAATSPSNEDIADSPEEGDGQMADRKRLVVKVLPAGAMKPIDMEGNYRVEINNHTGLARLLVSDTLYDREKDVDRLVEILRESGAEVEDRRGS